MFIPYIRLETDFNPWGGVVVILILDFSDTKKTDPTSNIDGMITPKIAITANIHTNYLIKDLGARFQLLGGEKCPVRSGGAD